MGLSSAALGLLGQNEVTKFLIVGSDGALVPYEPVTDIEGLDQMVKLRGDFDPIGLQIKTGERIGPYTVSANIKTRTFKASRFNFVVVVEFIEAQFAAGPYVWFLRTDELEGLAVRKKGLLYFSASANPSATRNKYLPWRYRPEELAGVVETAVLHLNKRGSRELIPTSRAEVRAAGRELGARFRI